MWNIITNSNAVPFTKGNESTAAMKDCLELQFKKRNGY